MSVGKTVWFAKTALDAFIHERIGFGQFFKILDVTFWIRIKNDSRVENIVGIIKFFDSPHDVERLRAPFPLDKRRHVAPRAMFRLQGTMIFVDNQGDDVFHQISIAFDLFLRIKTLIQDKMEVPFKRMSIDDAVRISVFGNDFLKFDRRVWQRV